MEPADIRGGGGKQSSDDTQGAQRCAETILPVGDSTVEARSESGSPLPLLVQFTKVSSLVSKRTWANFSQASICLGAMAPLKSFFASQDWTLPATMPSAYRMAGDQPKAPRPSTTKSMASPFLTTAR